MRLQIRIELISDAAFGRGDGVPGLIDEEVEYESVTGLPFIGGRRLKGLLVEECSNILYSVSQFNSSVVRDRLDPAALWLFGRPGSFSHDEDNAHYSSAELPEDLRFAVEAEIENGTLSPADILGSLTSIRNQTANDEETGAPREGSLRSIRVVLRGASLVAWLDFDGDPAPDVLALLAACVLPLRRGGNNRNRGLGRLVCSLADEFGSEHDINGDLLIDNYLNRFEQIIRSLTLATPAISVQAPDQGQRQ